MTLIWRILRALCGGDGAEQQWLTVIDYLVAENRVQCQQLAATGRRMRLTDEQRRELAVLGRKLKPALRSYISIVKPETIMAWYRRLVATRCDSSKGGERRPGRPPTAQTLKDLICRIARENPSWGYTRIRDQHYHLGHNIGRTTIVDILREAGLTPEPERRRQRTWAAFIEQHRSVIWATDFLTVDTITGCFYVLFFINLRTRQVVLGGITEHPHEAWMQQIARNMTDTFDGQLLGAKYMVHDRDREFTQSFDRILASAGIKPIKLPPRSPDLNPHAERWILSLKSEVLDHLILPGERKLRRALTQYLAHYHAERAHQGLNGEIIDPEGMPEGGEIMCRKRLGGLLSYYHRRAA